VADLRLTHLTYASATRPLATVDFDPSLTVLYGASDTGKSFVAESIEYMLGGSKLDLVSEAEGYSQILLGLELDDGTPLTLLRAPDSNTIRVHRADLRELVTRPSDFDVTAKHTARSKNSLSQFLLSHLGWDNLHVRTNDAGGTRELRLSDLVHLSVVPENRMVDKRSPVLHSSSANVKTAAASVMRLLLTGEGDAEVTPGMNPGQRRVNKGQVGLLHKIIGDLQAKLSTSENVQQLRERHRLLQTSIDGYSRAVETITQQHLNSVADRMAQTEELAAIEARLAEVSDLMSRFTLLEEQYRSDIDRLVMVTEAGNLLGFFKVGSCVFCGAEPEHQHPDHGERETTQLHLAVETEMAKTTSLLDDLLPTMQDLRNQLTDLSSRREELKASVARLDADIATTRQRLAPLREGMDQHLEVRSAIERDLDLHQRIEELEERRSRLDGEGAIPVHRPADYIPTRTLSAFDRVLQETLKAWKVPSVEYAEYDQYKMEIRAGNRLRASRGKGVRSVLHSAFTTALAQYCRGPHLGLVVLDSPVVTYRGPHSDPQSDAPGDDVPMTSTVVDHFYRNMLTFPGQVIIFENGDPPRDVIARARTHRFGLQEGDRPGFFPSRIGETAVRSESG
jgi:peptidoglycan hydrolase CwlO-like protein